MEREKIIGSKIILRALVVLFTITCNVNCYAEKEKPAVKSAEEYIADLKSEDIRTVDRALEYLNETEGPIIEETIVSALITALNDPSVAVRGRSALVLGNKKDKRAVPGLCELLKDPNDWVRSMAAYSLREIADESSEGALWDALEDKEKWVRIYAIGALSKIGTKEKLIPKFREMLSDRNKDVQIEAAKLLIQWGELKVVPPSLLRKIENKKK